MSPGPRRLLAVLLAVGLLAVLLLFVSLGSPAVEDRAPRIVARHIDLAVPPPPPPPPAVARVGPKRSLDLNIEKTAAPAPPSLLQDLQVKVVIPAGDLGPGNSRFGEVGSGFGDGGRGFGVKWEGFQAPYLDSIPSVRSAPLVDYPKALLDRGIDSIKIEVLIQIDESGKPTLLDILSTPYPPFDDALREFVSQVRFTSPTVGGRKVKAVYVWPLLFHHSTPAGGRAK